MGDIKVWKPTKRQNDFLTIPDTVFEALYGGSAGGGKSEVLLLLPLIREFYKYPRFKGIIFRRTYPELERELILRSHEYYPATGAVYSDAKKRWVWPHTGAVVQFGYVEHESDVRKYDTTEYNYMAFDELTSFTEFIYRYLAFSRCRSSDPNLPAIVRSASNPGNIGHGFVRARFVEPAREGYTIIKDSKTGLTRIFIPAKATDNPYLMKNDPQYVNRLQALPEAERLAKLEGDWWTFSGQVFEDWRIQPLAGDPPNAQHVIKPFEIPSWWPKLLAIDWGYSAMLYAVWGAISPKGRLIVYREYAAKKEKISTWAANVARLSQNDDLVDVVLDPSAWGNRGDEYTIAEQFEIHSGMRPRPADNDRIGGKVLLQELMRFRPRPPKIMPQEGFDPELADRILRIHGTAKYYEYLEAFTPEPEENVEELPKLQVFETCPVLINTIPLCVYNTPTMGKSVNLEDVAEFDGDDPYDGLRYLAKAAQNYLTSGVAENERREALDRAIADFKRTEDRLALHMRLDKIFAEERRSGLPVKRFHRARAFARTI